MEITGKIIQVLSKQTGQGKNGTWEKQEYILEVPGTYPKKVCFNLWGDKIAKFAIQEGQDLTVSIDVESREYNGRWYTDVKAWNVQAAGSSPASVPSASSVGSFETQAPAAGDVSVSSSEADDDLPF
ncbi:MAG: hypothetical protein RL577_1259 [Bacteroidota bacterium]|jgi:hypothetical protein